LKKKSAKFSPPTEDRRRIEEERQKRREAGIDTEDDNTYGLDPGEPGGYPRPLPEDIIAEGGKVCPNVDWIKMIAFVPMWTR
jgi:hypothetical protein